MALPLRASVFPFVKWGCEINRPCLINLTGRWLLSRRYSGGSGTLGLVSIAGEGKCGKGGVPGRSQVGVWKGAVQGAIPSCHHIGAGDLSCVESLAARPEQSPENQPLPLFLVGGPGKRGQVGWAQGRRGWAEVGKGAH